MAGIESLLIGRVLGDRYRIEEVIGRGGMGAVYRAVDERLGREVALKVITVASAADPESRERLRARFFREARSAAALPHHPNVVPVYDYGTDDVLGLDYLVMELLRGSDLASRLTRSGAPPLAASLKILVEAARGLAVGHRQGLIHRDVKPGNIFLTETQADEVQVRVVDFGIAKVADDDDTLAQLTQDGRVPHSPAYASPEQLRGLTQLSPAADVFSLGAVGYQLLTGERPYSESDRNRMSLGMAVEPPKIRDRNPAVPSTVEAVIRRALAYEPERRQADASELVSELEDAMRSIAEKPLEPYIGSAAIVTAAEDDRTLLAEDEDDRTLLAEDEDDRTLAAPPPPPIARPDRETRAIPPRRPLPPRHRRETRRGVGGILVWALVLAVLLGASVWGWSEFQRSQRVSLGLPEPDTLDLLDPDTMPEPDPRLVEADLINRDGVNAYLAGRLEESVRHFARAVELDPTNFSFRRNHGVALLETGRYALAEQELEMAARLDPDNPLPHGSLGRLHLIQGDTARAVAAYEQYIQRQTDPGLRRDAEATLFQIREAQDPSVPLLGDPVPVEPPADPPPTADVAPTPMPDDP
jgi:serine/threonine protein kinase